MKKPLITSGLGVAGLICLITAIACIVIAIVDGNPAAGLLAVVLTYFGIDSLWFEIGYIWTNGGLKDRYTLWKKRRYWNREKQIEHLLIMLQEDSRWMTHDPVVSALTDRYLKALSPDWYSINFERSSKVREQLGLDPKYDIEASRP